MTVAGIAWRSLRQRLLATTLTAASVALGVALIVQVFQVRDLARRAFNDTARGCDVVMGGPQTSALTTVLSSLFLVDKPVDTIPAAVYEEIKADPRVRYAVPYAVGDTYRGWRVVGTTPEFFDALQDSAKRPFRERIRSGGRVLSTTGFEAVVGAVASTRTGLVVGSTFTVTHGMEAGGEEHHEEWSVVGVLEPTGTPLDRAIFITLESFFDVQGHEAPAAPGGAEAPKVWAVSSVIVRLKSPQSRLVFLSDWRRRTDVRPAAPVDEVGTLFTVVEHVDRFFGSVVAWLVLVVSAIAILVGLYNSIQGRRREIAILRALGARPWHVASVVVLESVFLCVGGGIVGLLAGHGWVAAVAPMLLDRFGIRIVPEFGAYDLVGLLALVGMGALVGLLPAWRAFRVPVAENLHPID